MDRYLSDWLFYISFEGSGTARGLVDVKQVGQRDEVAGVTIDPCPSAIGITSN